MTTRTPDYQIFEVVSDGETFLRVYTGADKRLSRLLKERTTARFGRDPEGRWFASIWAEARTSNDFRVIAAAAAYRAALPAK